MSTKRPSQQQPFSEVWETQGLVAEDEQQQQDPADPDYNNGKPVLAPPGTNRIEIDFLGGLILAATLGGTGMMMSIAVLVGGTHGHGYKGPAIANHLMSLIVTGMCFALFFWRAFTNRPQAGKSIFLWAMVPFILIFFGVGIWTTVIVAGH